MSWDEFFAAREGLLLWEAFVTKRAKVNRDAPEPHIADAEAGARAFIRNRIEGCLKAGEPTNDTFYSLVGAAMVLTDTRTDVSVLQQPCLFVTADSPVPRVEPEVPRKKVLKQLERRT